MGLEEMIYLGETPKGFEYEIKCSFCKGKFRVTNPFPDDANDIKKANQRCPHCNRHYFKNGEVVTPKDD